MRNLHSLSAPPPAPACLCWAAIALAFCLAVGPIRVAEAANAEIGKADKVVNQVFRGGLLNRLQPDADVFQSEQITTRKDSATELQFADGSRLAIGADAEILLDRMVYDPDKSGLGGVARMTKGALRFVGGGAKVGLTIETQAVTIGVRGTRFSLYVTPAGTEIDIQEGTVSLTGTGFNQTMTAPSSAVIRVGAVPLPARPSPAFAQAVQVLIRLVGTPAQAASGGTGRGGSGPAPVMRTEPISDGGRVLGSLIYRADGRIDALDPAQKLRGSYDPVVDQTRDVAGHVVGPGNRLRQLLSLR
jgi:hypothetical protein